MVPQYVDISHFRQPFKNAVFSGFGDAAANAALVTTDASGVKTLLPAVAILLDNWFQTKRFTIFTTDASKEQILLLNADSPLAGSGLTVADWVSAQLAKGRSVIVSTNDPGGLAAVVSTLSGPDAASRIVQVVLAAVSTKADEIAAAGPTMPSAALVAPSKLGIAIHLPPFLKGAAPAGPVKAGMGGPVAVAVVALLVVGGIYYAFGRKPARRSY